MKLSDISGDRVFDVIAAVIDPIANIAEDEAAKGLFKRQKVEKDANATQILTNRLRKYLPQLIKNHKSDLIIILSEIEGCTTEEYSKSLTLAKLFKDGCDLLTDEAFMSFFTSSETSSGGVSENTADIGAEG